MQNVLASIVSFLGQLIDASFRPFFNWIPHLRKKTHYGRTDGQTDRQTDRRTDGRTDPLIEMRGRI